MRSAFSASAMLLVICTGCATERYGGVPASSPADSYPGAPAPSAQRPTPPPPVNLSGYSPSFKQGYSDGCSSARGSMRRDESHYRSDSDYMMGWGDGNSVCRNRR